MLKLENILPGSGKGTFFVPKDTEITGTFSADTSGTIAGTVNGDVFVKGKVIIAKEAVIRGDIAAKQVTVYGRITGDVRCTGKMIVQPGAHINGNITTLEIHIEKDAFVEGIITKTSVTYSIDNSVMPGEENTESEEQQNTTRPLRRNPDSTPESWF